MHKVHSEAGIDSLSSPTCSTPQTDGSLIAQLGPHHRDRIRSHLVSLPEDDRRLRFGYPISDVSISRYVRGIQFFRDAAFGAFDEDGRLLGFGHLALGDGEAEFAVSVDSTARRCGAGRALLLRGLEHARNRGHRVLMMVFMPENAALASLARRAGMQIVCELAECRAHIGLHPGTAESLLGEAWRETIASIDLGLRLGRQPDTVTSA
ncbi:MAG TPA: GNAT family N-acetyltransferase [Burkholderiaceae bacterium]|nr:GNAT family N-acetyltransferase [Burkholderiaceae bacterium]